MMHNVPVQSLIDHIKTAIDVDPWAKEMAEELLKEQNYRSWLMDMFHKYGRDDLIALLVLQGEEKLLVDMLKEQKTKQYNNHEVACILADLFGDPCACNFNDIDTWLPYKCDFRDTCCPEPVGVACWEQFLKYKESR